MWRLLLRRSWLCRRRRPIRGGPRPWPLRPWLLRSHLPRCLWLLWRFRLGYRRGGSGRRRCRRLGSRLRLGWRSSCWWWCRSRRGRSGGGFWSHLCYDILCRLGRGVDSGLGDLGRLCSRLAGHIYGASNQVFGRAEAEAERHPLSVVDPSGS